MALRSILVVDDLMANRLILKEMLRKDYNVLEAGSGAEALTVLGREQGRISAVLLDISMPGMSGFEVLSKIRATKQISQIPVIMITGSESEQNRVRSLSLGANDFVMKPYNSEILKHCLGNNIALREAAAAVSAMQRDKLTGLYSRESFFDKVRELTAAHEPGHYILACFDIDKFKVLNDRYGMHKGDEVLQHIADVFTEGFEPMGGVCGRIAADNFAVLYPAACKDTPELAAIRERAARVGGLLAPVSFRIGRYAVDDLLLPPAAMYDRASLAAASVKGRYDKKIAVYDDAMRERLIHEQEIALEMEEALKAGQFEAWFQPQFNHATDAMIGAEALVRWRHPQKGLIPPVQFISIFEQNGFIYALDKFIWEEVCRHIRQWMDGGRAPLPISVNISRYDILRPDVVDVLDALVQKYELPKDMLRLEVTESAFTEAPERIVGTVRELLKRGFTVEIDDFGSGYSSLNTLKDVPAQILKLDMKFLESGDDAQRGGNIVESIVRMAKWLDMAVIAEGVETLAQANYLRSIGCCYMQGYLYAKPMPADAYEKFCAGSDKQERLLTLETVDNLDNNAFWDPKSMDTLIFNSYVGGACIYEYHAGAIELLRATEKYAQIIGGAGMSVEDALRLKWAEHLDAASAARVTADIEESKATKKEVTGEYVFIDLPGCPHETYLRSTIRVIAAAGERYLVYCTNENITAQRRSEAREKLAQEQLSAIMQNISGGVTATVMEGDRVRLLFANKTHYELLGYTEAEYHARYRGAPESVYPDDVAMLLQKMRAIDASGEPGSIEFRIVRKDGAVRWLRSNVTLVQYPGEAKPVQLAVATDITEQREAECRVRQLSEQLQAIMDNVDMGIIAAMLSNGSAKYLFANEFYYHMLGYTKAQFEAEVDSPYQTVAPEDRQRIMEETARLNATRESALLIYNALTRDGRKRVFRAIVSIGAITGVNSPVQFTILRDITEEIETQRRERLAAEQIKNMMDDMPGGFVRMRVLPDGIKPVYINDGFLRLTDMTHEQAMALYAQDALAGVHPDDIAIVNASIAEMLERGGAKSLRYRLKHGDAGYIWVSVLGRAGTDVAGDTYLSIYYTDATEQVREEETQKDLLDNLPCGAGIYEFKDGQMSLTYQNKSYWELVGLYEEAYPDEAPMSAIHPDDIPIIMQELAAAMQQGRDVACDIRLRHLAQGYRAVHLLGRVVQKEGGRFVIYATFSPNDAVGLSYQQLLPVVLSTIMESTSDLAFAKDMSFRYLTSSRTFANMARQSGPEGVIGKTDYDLFDKATADKYRRDDEALLASGRAIVDMVEAIPSDDGTPHYASTSKYLMRSGDGAVIGMYGVGRDITAVMQQDSRLRLINDSVPGGIATYAVREGAVHIVYCNDGFCRLFGGSLEGYAQRGDFDPLTWVFEEDKPELQRQIAAITEHGEPIDCLFRVHALDGGYRWVNQSVAAAARHDGAVLFNALLMDVTQRQNALERLRVSEEESKLAVQLSGSITASYSLHDKTLTLAPAAAQTCGLPTMLENVPEGPIALGYIAEESAAAYRDFFASAQRGETAHMVFQQRCYGAWKWLEAKSAPIAAGGKPVKAVIAFHETQPQTGEKHLS